jgi:hypothetical protein
MSRLKKKPPSRACFLQGGMSKKGEQTMKKAKYETPELQELGKAERLTLGSNGGANDACNCAKKKSGAA